MNIINIIKNWFYPPVKNYGITQSDIDTKAASPSVTLQSEVVVSIATPTFQGVKGDGTIRQFPYDYQNGSSGCVAFSAGKIGCILNFLITGTITMFSAAWFYTQRLNKNYAGTNSQGMNFDDLVNIAAQNGCLVDSMLPSFGMSETALSSAQLTNADFTVAQNFKLPQNWVNIENLDAMSFEAVASTIEITKKPIMLWFQFGAGEFFFTQYPTIVSPTNPWTHSVVAIDTTTINSVKYIVIEESADSINFFRKYISKEFFIAKCILARYPITFKFEQIPNKPVFDGSIASAQDCLRYLGYFPSNIASTGIWGTISTAACAKFQTANDISPAVGFLGDETKAILLKQFNA